MYSYKIDVIERGNDIVVRARPLRRSPTHIEENAGHILSMIIKAALEGVALKRGQGIVIQSEDLNNSVSREIDRLFVGH